MRSTDLKPNFDYMNINELVKKSKFNVKKYIRVFSLSVYTLCAYISTAEVFNKLVQNEIILATF